MGTMVDPVKGGGGGADTALKIGGGLLLGAIAIAILFNVWRNESTRFNSGATVDRQEAREAERQVAARQQRREASPEPKTRPAGATHQGRRCVRQDSRYVANCAEWEDSWSR
jgi:hypothetical protein